MLETVASIIDKVDLASDSYLWSRLYGVFCSSFLFNPTQGISFLVKKGIFDKFIRSLVSKQNSFITNYDRRLLILSLMSVFKEKLKQEQLDEIALICFETAILCLHVQRMEEDLKLTSNGPSIGKGKGDKKKAAVNETEKQDIAVYNFIKGRTYNLAEILMDDEDTKSPDDEIMEFLVGTGREAQKSIQDIESPIKGQDEFVQFRSMYLEIKDFFQEKLNPLILEKISSSAKLVLPGVLQSQKISTVINNKNETDVLPRKIVKVRQRGDPTSIQ